MRTFSFSTLFCSLIIKVANHGPTRIHFDEAFCSIYLPDILLLLSKMNKGFVVCPAHIGLTKLNINSRRKKEPRLRCV